ncbi:PKD domain-containing protein [Candidatus Poribacteria bacterium]|nr:PKD domain-containing protein [Candidatus Poribacteria bacterium]
MKNIYILITIFSLTILALIPGCGEDESDPPIIFSLIAEPEIVAPDQTATLTVEAGDVDEDPLTYIWTAAAGNINGSSKTVSWSPPQEEGRYEITVTVSDGNDSVSQSIILWVWIPRPGDYYPLEVGYSWTFEDSDGNTINFEIIDTIEIQGLESDTTAYVKQTTSSDLPDAANFTYINIDSDVVYQYAMGGSNAGGDTIIFSPELPLYKLPLIPGETWEVEFNVKLPEGFFIGNGRATYEVISEEDLTVEAGSFEHVFKIKEDFTWELLGNEIDRIITYHWLAPNVGIVKFTQEENVGGENIHTEATLKSYYLK